MMILALESSAKPVSVAVCEVAGTQKNVKLLGQYFQNNGFSHSRTLMSMTESLLKNLGITLADIDLIAVASGPGSFTGVRIGVSAAKGMAWGLDIKMCGVSTLEAMAFQTQIVQTSNAIICPVMDARRGQVYNALFEWSDGTLIRLCEDRAISLEELAADLQLRTHCQKSVDLKHQSHSKTDADLRHNTHRQKEVQSDKALCTPVLLIGDGALISNDFLTSKEVNCAMPPELMHYQTAYGVALVAVNGQQHSAVELEPSYLRPSQAERERSQSSSSSSNPA